MNIVKHLLMVVILIVISSCTWFQKDVEMQDEEMPALTEEEMNVAPPPVVKKEEPKITEIPEPVAGDVIHDFPPLLNSAITYKVKKGDNLHWLAAWYYGNPRLWTNIYDANREKISNPNVLPVGLDLTIPPK